MVATRILPWAAVLLAVIAGIVALSFGRRGDPAWVEIPAPALAAAQPSLSPVAPNPSVTLRGGLPANGRIEIDVSSIQGEQTGQRRVHSQWRLQADGTVVLPEPAEEDMIIPADALATLAADGTVTITGKVPEQVAAALADGVRALLALRIPLQAGERRVGERVVVGADRFLVTAAAPTRLALAAEASSLPGAEGDETLVTLVDGAVVRIERHWTRPDGAITVVTKVTLTPH